jgi:hypothetical protein
MKTEIFVLQFQLLKCQRNGAEMKIMGLKEIGNYFSSSNRIDLINCKNSVCGIKKTKTRYSYLSQHTMHIL